MPSKPLTVMVPEPNQDGCCPWDCPLAYRGVGDYVGCGEGLGERIDFEADFPLKPGPGCPQHQQEKEEKGNG